MFYKYIKKNLYGRVEIVESFSVWKQKNRHQFKWREEWVDGGCERVFPASVAIKPLMFRYKALKGERFEIEILPI